MIKVFFCCSWDSDPVHFLKVKYAPLTPNSKGIWKNLIAVTDIKEADWLVIIDDIHNSQRKAISEFDKNKVICIPREPHRKNPTYLNYGFKYSLTYNNFFHCWASMVCKKNYDYLLNFKRPKKPKLCSTVTSSFDCGIGLYRARVNFIKKLSKQNKFLDKIDIFGYGWNKNVLGKMFKGAFPGHVVRSSKPDPNIIPNTTGKWDGLENYSYSIAVENSCVENYFSEKFTDCILAYTIPIYYGCPNIDKFFPKESYYWLDITSPNCMEELDKILNTPITEKQIKAVEKARDLILNKYMVWCVVSDIIENDK